MFFNNNDNENGIIIFFEESRLNRRNKKIGSTIGAAFKIIKILLLFLVFLFLYHRLPYFISNIIYNLKKFLDF